MADTTWAPDVLGDGYEQQVIDLGEDPDGEGPIRAVLVRRVPRAGERVEATALYVHGYSDYFFHTELADFLAERGIACYALDLRKCGRSRVPGHTPHFVSDLSLYDDELDRAAEIIAAEHPGLGRYVVAHSTGGLVVALWLDRLRRAGRSLPLAGVILNSPWLDLQRSYLWRTAGTAALHGWARFKPMVVLKSSPSGYGPSLHASRRGEWEFDTELKPLDGVPVRVAWLAAIRRAQAALHRGLEVGAPVLVLHSSRSSLVDPLPTAIDTSDVVIDAAQTSRWATALGGNVTTVAVDDARHDVFLSLDAPRAATYRTLDGWLRWMRERDIALDNPGALH
jgi:alpha-beta hydrolase superfamily lysophospholipase